MDIVKKFESILNYLEFLGILEEILNDLYKKEKDQKKKEAIYKYMVVVKYFKSLIEKSFPRILHDSGLYKTLKENMEELMGRFNIKK